MKRLCTGALFHVFVPLVVAAAWTHFALLAVGDDARAGYAPDPERFTVGMLSDAPGGDRLAAAAIAHQTAATTGSAQALEGYTVATHSDGTVWLLLGTMGNVEHAGAGYVAGLRGLNATAFLSGAGDAGTATGADVTVALLPESTGSVLEAYGLKVTVRADGAGEMGAAYGAYLDVAHQGATPLLVLDNSGGGPAGLQFRAGGEIYTLGLDAAGVFRMCQGEVLAAECSAGLE